jgi:hypothetical protein
MHSANPPSHPELLDWLARDTAEHGYDLRRLVRGLVLSKTYSRSSRWTSSEAPPAPHLFAVARLRAMTPAQLATSLKLATTDVASAAGKPEEIEKRVEGIEASARGMAGLFEQPREDFQIGVAEALLFSNGDQVQKDLLSDTGDRLVGRLKQLPGVNDRVDMAVRCVLSRPAGADETKLLAGYLEKRADRPADACRQLVWALLTSAEFRFNY